MTRVYASSYLAFSLFGVGASSFQSPCSPVLCFFSLYSFLLHVVSYNISPPQFRSSSLLVSTHFHVLNTVYGCVVSFDVSQRCHLSVVVSHATYLKNVTGYEITKAGIGRNGVSSSHYLLYISRCRKFMPCCPTSVTIIFSSNDALMSTS